MAVAVLAAAICACSPSPADYDIDAGNAREYYDRADSLRLRAGRLGENGDRGLSHDLFNEAIGIYSALASAPELRDRYGSEDTDNSLTGDAYRFSKTNLNRLISLCRYRMAVDYHNLRDTVGLNAIISEMQAVQKENPQDNDLKYDLYSVKMTRYLAEYEDTGLPALRDSMLFYAKEAAFTAEKIPSELYEAHEIQPVWGWYNIAVMYDLYFTPPVTDSTDKYLAMAEYACETAPNLSEISRMESRISIEDLKAWSLYYQGKYVEAERKMLEVLDMIDIVEQDRPNSVLTERGQAYEFMAELYKNTGNTAKALEYQTLVNENDRARYDASLREQLHDVRERYESEKKTRQIEYLDSQRTAMFRLLMLLSFLLLALVGVFVLYRKNARAKLYEAALEADARLEAQREEAKNEKNAAMAQMALMRDRLLEDFTDPKYYSAGLRELAGQALRSADIEKIAAIAASASRPLSAIDKKYLLCFMSGLKADNIAALFNIEPESVYTVRYRLKKKFSNKNMLI